MSSFPSSQERTVASSLLLLHTTPPYPSCFTPIFRSDPKDPFEEIRSNDFRGITPTLSDSNSSSSSLTNDDVSSEDKIKSRTVSFFSATARYRQMKFKIVRKIRSKVTWTSLTSGDRNQNEVGCNSGEASSCLSSNSSGISSAGSLQYANRGNRCVRSMDDDDGMGGGRRRTHHEAAKNAVGPPHLCRRGEAILKLLSPAEGLSELKIRQMLGDSPDTSKALRMLLRVDAVKRSGSGGWHDPYVYTING